MSQKCLIYKACAKKSHLPQTKKDPGFTRVLFLRPERYLSPRFNLHFAPVGAKRVPSARGAPSSAVN